MPWGPWQSAHSRWELLAVGSLVVGRMRVGKAILKSVSIEHLTIARLRVRELTATGSLTAPAANLLPETHSQ